MDLLALGRELIAANTVSRLGTRAAVDILRPLYEEAGLRVEVQEVRDGPVRHQNLIGGYPGADRAGLLLVTHLDTVDPGPAELWTEANGQPFALTQRGDRLFGLGTADTKLDALCKLFAAREFRGRQLRRSLQLLGTFGEEVGVKGARHFVSTPQFQARFACCSEPSELVIIRAHKGYGVVRIELEMLSAPEVSGPFEEVRFEGKSAHSATPDLGINAIDLALAAVGGAPFVSLHGGTVTNKVPSRCVVVRPIGGASLVERPPEPSPRDASAVAAVARRTFALWR
jgi:acetylornithine deacetylase/succinyl-diaminopimelate desuccinylase-like protein